MKTAQPFTSLILLTVLAASPIFAQKYKTDIPPAITTPSELETRLGTLHFIDGFPDDATVQKVYDNLDFQRGVQAFLTAMPAASLLGDAHGAPQLRRGQPDRDRSFETLLDSRSLFLTANTESSLCHRLARPQGRPGRGRDARPTSSACVDDFWFHYVTDLGNAGPGQGQGRQVPVPAAGLQGHVPHGYHVFSARRPTATGSACAASWWMAIPSRRSTSIKKHLRIYPLAQAANPPATTFINVSGKAFNTIHAMDFTFFEEVERVVQEEPGDGDRPGDAGPARLHRHREGQAVRARRAHEDDPHRGGGGGQRDGARAWPTGRALTEAYLYPEQRLAARRSSAAATSSCTTASALLDARTFFFFTATGITPAMSMKMVGVGSQYAVAFVDATGPAARRRQDLPAAPAAQHPGEGFLVAGASTTPRPARCSRPTSSFRASAARRRAWSVNRRHARWTSTSVPSRPPGKESNWVQTCPGKGWFVDPAPLRPAPAVVRQDVAAGRDRRNAVNQIFNKRIPNMKTKHRLINLVLLGAFAASLAFAQSQGIPPEITTPDKLESRLGTLEFKDGAPSAATVEKSTTTSTSPMR